jgi:uncharacterized coiled-coil protein SlyX
MTVRELTPEQVATLQRVAPNATPGGFFDSITRNLPDVMPGGGVFERTPRFINTDADRAAAEYRFSNPYADLQDFLLEQPVFDRDPIRQPSVTTGLTRLDRPDFSEGDIKQRFTDVFERQRAIEKAQEDARAKAISDLRDELAKETASAADAAAQSRSELTQTLEGRIAEAREAASQEVADQATVIEDLQGRIGSLTQDLGGISKTISEEQAKLSAELRESQKGAVDLVQGRIDGLTDELKAVSDSVGEEAVETTNNLRNEREQIVGNLESQIHAPSRSDSSADRRDFRTVGKLCCISFTGTRSPSTTNRGVRRTRRDARGLVGGFIW